MLRGFGPEEPPNGGTDTRCWNCGAHVTPQFARVMGDNDNEVYACPSCRGFRELSAGASGDASAASDAPPSER